MRTGQKRKRGEKKRYVFLKRLERLIFWNSAFSADIAAKPQRKGKEVVALIKV